MRLDALTGLRWWAAFGVFMFHMRLFAPLPFLSPFALLGHFGVMFFFILSGFVLTLSSAQSVKPGSFYWRRFSRIWPANFVALLLAIPVYYSFNPNPDQWWIKAVSIPILLLSIPIIQGWWRDPTILFSGNPAAWTLTCEFFFYALHPLINRFLGKAGLRALLGIGIGVFIVGLAFNAASVSPAGGWTQSVPFPVARLNEFVLGMVIGAAVRLGYLTKIPSWIAFVLLAGFAIALGFIDGFAVHSWLAVVLSDYRTPILTLIFCFTIGVVASKNARGEKSVLQWRPLVILGEWSFAFYLVHATCITLLRNFIGARHASWTNLGWYAILLVFALVVAGALHLLVERPVEKRLRNWWDARRAVTA